MKKMTKFFIFNQLIIAFAAYASDGYFYQNQQDNQNQPPAQHENPSSNLKVNVQEKHYPGGYYYPNAQKPLPEGNENQYNMNSPAVNGPAVINAIRETISRYTRNYNIDIHLKEGEVTLNGVVNSDDERSNIENAVRNIPGVRKLNSNLTVQQQQR
jgi:hypothetical protein